MLNAWAKWQLILENGENRSPYKGKGIRYKGEYIFRKEGKKK